MIMAACMHEYHFFFYPFLYPLWTNLSANKCFFVARNPAYMSLASLLPYTVYLNDLRTKKDFSKKSVI